MIESLMLSSFLFSILFEAKAGFISAADVAVVAVVGLGASTTAASM